MLLVLDKHYTFETGNQISYTSILQAASLQSVGASCISSHFLIFRVLREGKKGGQMAGERGADAGVCHGGIAHPFAVDLPRLRRPMKNKHAAVKYRAAPKETSKVVLIWGEASIKKYHPQQFQDV